MTSFSPTPLFPAARYDLMILVASAGGVQALIHIIDDLPDGFPCALLVVQHLDPHRESQMSGILNRHSRLRVEEVKNGITLRAGRIYLSPPDHHVQVQPGGLLKLSHADAVRFNRPSADFTLKAAAEALGTRLLVVILTGSGKDGSQGVKDAKAMGSYILAQSISSSDFPSMPRSAIETGCVDRVLDLKDVPAALVALATRGEDEA